LQAANLNHLRRVAPELKARRTADDDETQ